MCAAIVSWQNPFKKILLISRYANYFNLRVFILRPKFKLAAAVLVLV